MSAPASAGTGWPGWLPPLLAHRTRPAQAVTLLVLPPAFGSITGLALDLSAAAFTVLTVLSVLGGLTAGLEHPRAGSGALRGAWGGLLFGAGVLLAHQAHGGTATVDLPDPALAYAATTTLAGSVLGLVGGAVRARARPAVR